MAKATAHAGVAPSRERRLQEQARFWAQTKSAAELETLRRAAPSAELAKHVRFALKWRKELDLIERFGVLPHSWENGEET